MTGSITGKMISLIFILFALQAFHWMVHYHPSETHLHAADRELNGMSHSHEGYLHAHLSETASSGPGDANSERDAHHGFSGNTVDHFTFRMRTGLWRAGRESIRSWQKAPSYSQPAATEQPEPAVVRGARKAAVFLCRVTILQSNHYCNHTTGLSPPSRLS